MTNEELYRQYLSGDAEAFEQLYLQMQGFIGIGNDMQPHGLPRQPALPHERIGRINAAGQQSKRQHPAEDPSDFHKKHRPFRSCL